MSNLGATLSDHERAAEAAIDHENVTRNLSRFSRLAITERLILAAEARGATQPPPDPPGIAAWKAMSPGERIRALDCLRLARAPMADNDGIEAAIDALQELAK